MFWHMGGIRTSLDTFWSQAGWFLRHILQTVWGGNTTRAPIGPATLGSQRHHKPPKPLVISLSLSYVTTLVYCRTKPNWWGFDRVWSARSLTLNKMGWEIWNKPAWRHRNACNDISFGRSSTNPRPPRTTKTGSGKTNLLATRSAIPQTLGKACSLSGSDNTLKS